MKLVSGILVIIAVVGPLPCLAQTPCPNTTFTCEGVTQTLAGDEDSRTCINDFGSAGAQFDYSQGTSGIHYFLLNVAIGTEDTFWFDGPGGQTVHARVVFTYSGQACAGDVSSNSGTFEVTPGTVQNFVIFSGFQQCRSDHQTLTENVAFEVGQTFTIGVGLAYDGGSASGGSGFLSAAIHFEDLPMNVVVRSCHGYRQDGPVPARTRSWGAVKSLYRN